MESIFEFIMEVIFDVFCEGFVALGSAFVPSKTLTKKQKKFFKYVCTVVSCVLLVGLLIGIVILAETSGRSFWGWLTVALSVVYLLAGIIGKCIGVKK